MRVDPYGTAIYVDEDDIAMYTMKSIDDPRTLNKTVYIRPPKNILSQLEVVRIWEKLIGKDLQKSSISAQDFLALMKGKINFTGGLILLQAACGKLALHSAYFCK